MITSTSNSQIKNVINLIKKSKDRKVQGLFVVEGKRMFEETPKERIDSLFISESYEKENRKSLSGYSYETVSDEVFSHMSDTKTPQGIMALVKMSGYSVEDMIHGDNPLIIILENLQDPGNLGTIIRTAEGAGVDGIIMTSGTVDIYNPKVIRSTMGAMYRMKFAYTDDLAGTVKLLKSKGIITYAAHLKGAVDYVKCDYTKGTAFFIGNEGNGLTDEATDLADRKIIIPMKGKLESLNAAVSGALLMYEAARQRRG